MATIVFCLEEPSAWEMLSGILPRILPESVNAFPIIFEGKSDLDKRLERRVRVWQTPDTYFLILRDKDSSDCLKVKAELAAKVRRAGRSDSLVRIACHELESFYLGDLAAVEKGLSLKKIAKLQDKQKYRNPDRLSNAAEEISRLTGLSYKKIAGSRAISKHLLLDGSNRSRSFNVLVEGIRTIVKRLDDAKT